MEIRLTKKATGESVLTCKRKDGTETWRHIIRFFAVHDLCHYAVEKTFSLKNAFYGMVAAGINITDFDLPADQRKFQISEEAIFTEHLVILLTIEYTQGKVENFTEIFSAAYRPVSGYDFSLRLTPEKLDEIRNTFSELMLQWNSLPANQSLNLIFEE